MNRVENINYMSQSLGVSVSEHSTSRAFILKSLKERGIDITPTTISRLRGGSTSGRKSVRRLKGSEILRQGNVTSKDNFYLDIAELGVAIRTYPDWGGNRLTSVGFTETIAETLGINDQILRRGFRAMRVDLVLEELANPNWDLLSFFRPVAEEYISAYTIGPRGPSKNVVKLDSEWDRKTVGGFYRALYKNLVTPSALRIWPPYEVEVLRGFYRQRISLNSRISFFDRLVIESDLFNVPEGRLESTIRVNTGIKYDPYVTYNHLNVLVNARP